MEKALPLLVFSIVPAYHQSAAGPDAARDASATGDRLLEMAGDITAEITLLE